MPPKVRLSPRPLSHEDDSRAGELAGQRDKVGSLFPLERCYRNNQPSTFLSSAATNPTNHNPQKIFFNSIKFQKSKTWIFYNNSLQSIYIFFGIRSHVEMI